MGEGGYRISFTAQSWPPSPSGVDMVVLATFTGDTMYREGITGEAEEEEEHSQSLQEKEEEEQREWMGEGGCSISPFNTGNCMPEGWEGSAGAPSWLRGGMHCSLEAVAGRWAWL